MSRPSRPRLSARARTLLLAAALHLAVAASWILHPLLVVEMMEPPRAQYDLVFRSPASPGAPPAGPTAPGGPKGGRERRPRPAPPGVPAPPAAPAAPPRTPIEPPRDHAAAAPAGAPASRIDAPQSSPADLLEPGGRAAGDGTEAGEGTGTGSGPGGGDGPGDGTGTGDCTGCPPGGGPAGAGERILEEWDPRVEPPVLIPSTRVLPRYPAIARRARIQASVILRIVIGADGRVGAIEVLRSPDQRWGFDLEAIEAVKRWRYRPAVLHGAPVPAYARVIVEFALVD